VKLLDCFKHLVTCDVLKQSQSIVYEFEKYSQEGIQNSEVTENFPFAFDHLLMTYIKLYRPLSGIPPTYEACLSLYQAFSQDLIEDIILDHNETWEKGLLEFEEADMFMRIIWAPFEGASYPDGIAELIWYEKFSLITVFLYLTYLNQNKKEYKILDRVFKIPSREMANTLNKDEEFCKSLIKVLKCERTLLIDILKQMDHDLHPVKKYGLLIFRSFLTVCLEAIF